MLMLLWMLLTKLCKFLHEKAFSTMEATTHELIHPTIDVLLSMLAVLLEPIEMTCDPTYLVNFLELYTVLASFQSHEGRVLNSLNGIKDMKSRLTSKAEYMLSGRKRMMWDISLINIKIIIPWENGKSEIHKLVLGLTAVTFSSKHDVSCFAPDINVPSQFMRNLIDYNSSSELLEGTQIQDLYALLEIKLVDFQFLAETLDVVQDIDWVIYLLLGNLLNHNILLKQVSNQD
ncbi:unnamed protein product [Lactuca saligna]|uniref:Uncharacterized protein n=1 Tax=Lactuca saligna TaxID=75948 RepID=A0AA35YDY1_LACSI|nr:unnamed protein product [Lactuca saligna]